MRRRPRWPVFALAVLCNLFWAGAYVTGKVAIGGADGAGFGPYKTAFFRFALAGALLGVWGLWRAPGTMRLRRADLPAFGRLALLGMCLTYVFNYAGLSLSTGTAAALIMATEPVWIALLAVLFLRERFTPPRAAGIVLGLAGALLVVISTHRVADAGSAAVGAAMLGNLLMIVSLLWESVAVLTVKHLVARYPGRVIVTYEFLLGALLLAPFALWETLTRGPIAPTPAAWGAFLYLLGPCTLIAYTLWYRLLEITDVAELSVFIFLQPVVGTLMGVFLFRDPFTTLTALGALLVLLGVAGLTRAERVTEVPASPDVAPEMARAAGE